MAKTLTTLAIYAGHGGKSVCHQFDYTLVANSHEMGTEAAFIAALFNSFSLTLIENQIRASEDYFTLLYSMFSEQIGEAFEVGTLGVTRIETTHPHFNFKIQMFVH